MDGSFVFSEEVVGVKPSHWYRAVEEMRMKGVDYDKIVQSYLNLFQTSMNKASVKDNSENTKYAEY